jgi:hypothetical protein
MVDETLHRVYPSEVYMYDQSKVVIIEEQNQGMRTSTKSILSICMLAYIIFFFLKTLISSEFQSTTTCENQWVIKICESKEEKEK